MLLPLRHAKFIVRKGVTALLSRALDDHVLQAVKYDKSQMIGWLRKEWTTCLQKEGRQNWSQW